MVIVHFMQMSGEKLASAEFCIDATIATFNAALKSQAFRIVQGMSYCRGGRSYSAQTDLDERVFSDIEDIHEQEWYVLFNASVTGPTSRVVNLGTAPPEH